MDIEKYGLTLTQIGPNKWRLEEDVDGWGVHVPKGFKTDLASVPKILWNIFPPHGTYSRAAVVHDFLYVSQTGTKKEADDIFLQAMIDLEVPKWQRRLMYRAVRWFGRFPK